VQLLYNFYNYKNC